ncbi:MAG: dihydroneopterin aldolase [Acidobacteria bacterium]|nr:MAG: dihydroneopterin aldolase [Acidobacteriota bacterium]
MDRLVLSGIKVSGIHGVLDSERVSHQPFEINLVIETDLSAAANADDLGLTIDYSQVAAEVSRMVREESFGLIEALASRIADAVLADDRISAVEVEVRKLRPEVEARLSYAAVQIRRSNS